MVHQVEPIERATLAAVAPEEVLEIEGWLLGLDPGSIRRAASAVPLAHNLPVDPATLDRIEAAYAARELPAAFRVADTQGLEGVCTELTRRGYASQQPTLVMTATLSKVLEVTDLMPAEVAQKPNPAWAAVFLGEGFDPVDGAYRVKALSRSAGACFGSVCDGGQTVAVGCGSFGHGWASFHGMRTARHRRGEGLAGRVLAGLARAALDKGLDQAFLQVEAANQSAQSLYRRAGFQTAWRYEYWSQP